MGTGRNYSLFDEPLVQIDVPQEVTQDLSALEDPSFSFEFVSQIAEAESWRKELHRPLHHVHKWWAQRLGSVFRAMILAATSPAGSDIRHLFYEPARLSGVTIFDPFMGSGTTLGETLKLGGRAIGRDINPVAHFLVRVALSLCSVSDLQETFAQLSRTVAPVIQQYYQAKLNGEIVPVLYYFWVKQVPCTQCSTPVDLFSSRIFVQNAYPERNPSARCTCPACGNILNIRFDSISQRCDVCCTVFNPQHGNIVRDKVTCPNCRSDFRVIEAISRQVDPPSHRLYAKLVLDRKGTKHYLATDDFDRRLYEKAERTLAEGNIPYPRTEIMPGHNTNQVLRYNYRRWDQMFNSRQLLCLGLLAKKIAEIDNEIQRSVFSCLFSGILEFNNMFASFKGEGTGAVRHMFSHHILKPERLPLEANPWGLTKSSGAFSTLFQSRILRAVEYAHRPYELRIGSTGATAKVYGISGPIIADVAGSYAEFEGKNVYLSCGPSQNTDIPSGSVDLVVTDPPFFDNVHYSELADFFYVWQRLLMHDGANSPPSSRSNAEVQNRNVEYFTTALTQVWLECHRILKNKGLLIFTYHHSRQEGWSALLCAIQNAGFVVTAVHPVKSEMSGAAPKAQSREPIDVDIIIVCRKSQQLLSENFCPQDILSDAARSAGAQMQRFNKTGRLLGKGDVRVILMANVLRALSCKNNLAGSFERVNDHLESTVEAIFRSQSVAQDVAPGTNSQHLE